MSPHGGAEALAQRHREIEQQVVDEQRVIRQIARQQIREEYDLAVGEQHRELGTGEADVRGVAIGDGLVVGQPLDGAIELSGALERAHEARLFVEHRFSQ